MNWFRLNPKEQQKRIDAALDLLTHGCDGPVTRFVVISRALELASVGAYCTDAIANALDAALDQVGDETLVTGS